MANGRDDREEEPKIKIVDRRMLTEEERQGTGPVILSASGAPVESERPRLEVIGGGAPAPTEPVKPEPELEYAGEAAGDMDTFQEDELDPEADLSEEEMEQLRQQIEEEQFAALEQQAGRPLTDDEKEHVRGLMAKQAESMSKLEVAPILVQTISELSRYTMVHLGLVPNPYTNLIARNDNEARLAIDAFGALHEVMKNRVDPRVSAELGRVLNDLRVNYTRISGVQITPPGGPRIIR